MTASIHLAHRSWSRTRDGVTAIGTWLHEDGRQRPCMVLIRAGEEGHDHTDPCVIPLEGAWRWSEDIGDGAFAARQIAHFVQKLRMSPSKRSFIRLGMFVHDCLDDLLTMPVRGPGMPNAVIAEVTITDHDGRTQEVELVDDV